MELGIKKDTLSRRSNSFERLGVLLSDNVDADRRAKDITFTLKELALNEKTSFDLGNDMARALSLQDNVNGVSAIKNIATRS